MGKMMNYENGLMSCGVPVTGMTMGNVYVVADTASSNYTDIYRRYGKVRHQDGSMMLHPHTSSASTVTLNGFKSAAAACVADRDDYIIVMPASSTYYVDEAISLAKKGCHLICPAGLGLQTGANNAARIQQITANVAVVSIAAAAVEVAGLYIKHKACTTSTLGSGVDITTNGYCPNVHHNYFAINGSGATNSPIIAIIGGSAGHGAWGQIHHNKFHHLTDGTTFASIIQVNTGANNTQISYNDYNAGCGAGVTVTDVIAIGAGALYCEVNYNTFSAGATNGPYGITESTITNCINLSLSSTAIGNRGAVQAGRLLAGGVAARSFCDNIDGASSTTAGQASQLET